MKEQMKKWIFRIRGEQDFQKLLQMGMKVGTDFIKMEGCRFDYSHCWLIEIGDRVTFSSNVEILAHDASTKRILGYTKIGRVKIGSDCFIGSGVTILPGVTIGDNCIVGAGSLVTKDLPPHTVCAGIPAKVITTTEEYVEKNRKLLQSRPVYDAAWTLRGNITREKKRQMLSELEDGIGFIE